MSSRQVVSAGAYTFACALTAGCGQGMPAAAVGPAPTVMPPASTASPSPTPATSATYLHVLQRPWVMAYRIDPTGRLLPPVTQRVANDLVTLSSEPQGRFVLGGREVLAPGYWASTIVSYAPDPRDGTLVKRSESDVLERPHYCYEGTDGHTCREAWVWLKAGTNRVHGIWEMAYGPAGPTHYEYSYASAALGMDGQLGQVNRLQFPTDFDRGLAAVDVQENVLYKTEPYSPAGNGALEGHVIDPDGSLTRIGTTHLCLARRFDGSVEPLLTVRGFVFAQARIDSWWGSPSVCTYQGLRMKPLEAFDFGATRAEAHVPEAEDEPVLVAMNTQTSSGGSTHEQLRLFALADDAALQVLDVEELPSPSRQILFHPSGRALYVVDAASALHAYAVSAAGELNLMMSIEHAGESMAITWH